MILIVRHIYGVIDYDLIVKARSGFLRKAKGDFTEIQAGLTTIFLCKRPELAVSETPERVRIAELTHPSKCSDGPSGVPYGQGFILDAAKSGAHLRIVSDMINSRPFFISHDSRMVASHVMLLDPAKSSIDADVLRATIYMSYNPFFGRTLFSGISQTFPGCETLMDGAAVKHVPAENSLSRFLRQTPDMDADAFGDWLSARYPEALKDFAGDGETHLLISGGADSRGLLSVLHRIKGGGIHGHSYGPSMFFDNIIANEACRRLPGVRHSIHDFDNGNAILSLLDEIIMHSNLGARLDDTFRNLVIARELPGREPVLSCLVIDSLLGDETYPGVSPATGFLEGYAKGPFRRLSDFLAFSPGLSSSFISPQEKDRIDRRLLEHYTDAAGLDGLSEQAGYDLLNVLCRHGKGTVGMLYGMASRHQPVIPLLDLGTAEVAFRLEYGARCQARAYLDALLNRMYQDEHKGIITTRGMITLSELLANNFQVTTPEQVSERERMFYRDYYQLYYLTNGRYRQFIDDNVVDFNRRGICDADLAQLIGSPTHSRPLLSIAILNHYMGKGQM